MVYLRPGGLPRLDGAATGCVTSVTGAGGRCRPTKRAENLHPDNAEDAPLRAPGFGGVSLGNGERHHGVLDDVRIKPSRRPVSSRSLRGCRRDRLMRTQRMARAMRLSLLWPECERRVIARMGYFGEWLEWRGLD